MKRHWRVWVEAVRVHWCGEGGGGEGGPYRRGEVDGVLSSFDGEFSRRGLQRPAWLNGLVLVSWLRPRELIEGGSGQGATWDWQRLLARPRRVCSSLVQALERCKSSYCIVESSKSYKRALLQPRNVLANTLIQPPPARPTQREEYLRPPAVVNLAQILPQLSKVGKLPLWRDLAEDILDLGPVERLCDGPDPRVRDGGEGESGEVEESSVLGVDEPFWNARG